jgi:hypothetical protein
MRAAAGVSKLATVTAADRIIASSRRTSGEQMDRTVDVLAFLAYGFIFLIGALMLLIAVFFVIDVSQTRHAIRRNFPVIGRFRYVFERLGEFFRQYFFALDREELPFNRAERSWVYRACKKSDNTIAFGSTRDLRRVGTVIFLNDPWPVLETDVAEPGAITIGPDCREPYRTASLVNISAMSYGAISRPAVRALSAGAKHAGIWLNTGEGGLSPYHLEGGAELVATARGFMLPWAASRRCSAIAIPVRPG